MVDTNPPSNPQLSASSLHSRIYDLFFTRNVSSSTTDGNPLLNGTVSDSCTNIFARSSGSSNIPYTKNTDDLENPLLSPSRRLPSTSTASSYYTLVDILSTAALAGYVNEIQLTFGMNTTTYNTLEEGIMILSHCYRYAPKYFFAEHKKFNDDSLTRIEEDYNHDGLNERFYYDARHRGYNPYLITPLIYHIMEENIDRVRYLLKCGANPSLPSSIGICPLLYAVRTDNEDIVQALLRHPLIDVNACVTLSSGHHYMGTSFLNHQQLYQTRDTDGNQSIPYIPYELNNLPYIYHYYLPPVGSPLLFAIMMGNERIVEMLLNHPTVSLDCRGYPLFHAVLWINNYEICKLFIHKLLETNAPRDTMDYYGLTPFHIAILRAYTSRSLRILELLCKSGFDTNFRDFMNETPLHTVFLQYGIPNDYPVTDPEIGRFGSEIVKLLLNYQANPNALYERTDLDTLYQKESPGYPKPVIRRWRYRGTTDNPNNNNNNNGAGGGGGGGGRWRNGNGGNPRNRGRPIAPVRPPPRPRRRMGGNHANNNNPTGNYVPDRPDGEGILSSFTPLHMVATLDSSWEKAAFYLLQAGADIQAVDAKGRTPIHLALLSASAYTGQRSFDRVRPEKYQSVGMWGIGGDSSVDDYATCFREFLRKPREPLFFLNGNEEESVTESDRSATQRPTNSSLLFHHHTVLSRLLHPPTLMVSSHDTNITSSSASTIVISSIDRVKYCLRKPDEQGYLPFHYLIDNETDNDTIATETLLKILYLYGSPIDTKLPNGYNSVQHLLIHDHIHVATLLPLLFEWDRRFVNDRTRDGKTVLHLLMERVSNHWDSSLITSIVHNYLAQGLSIDATDIHSRTPLHYLVRNIHFAFVENQYRADTPNSTLDESYATSLGCLLRNGADVTVSDRKGNNVLHELVRDHSMMHLRLRILYLFMHLGSSVVHRNQDKLSPLKYLSNTRTTMFRKFLQDCYNSDDIHASKLFYQYKDTVNLNLVYELSSTYPTKAFLSAKVLDNELSAGPEIFPLFRNFNQSSDTDTDTDNDTDNDNDDDHDKNFQYLINTHSKDRALLAWELWYRWDISVTPFMAYNFLTYLGVPSCESQLYNHCRMSQQYGIDKFCHYVAHSPFKHFRNSFLLLCILLACCTPLILSIGYRILWFILCMFWSLVTGLITTIAGGTYAMVIWIAKGLYYGSIGRIGSSVTVTENTTTLMDTSLYSKDYNNVTNIFNTTITNVTDTSSTDPVVPESVSWMHYGMTLFGGILKYTGTSIGTFLGSILRYQWNTVMYSLWYVWSFFTPDNTNHYIVGPSLVPSMFHSKAWDSYYPAVSGSVLYSLRFSRNISEFYTTYLGYTRTWYDSVTLLQNHTTFPSNDTTKWDAVNNFLTDYRTNMDDFYQRMNHLPTIEPYTETSTLRIFYALNMIDVINLTIIRLIWLMVFPLIVFYIIKYTLHGLSYHRDHSNSFFSFSNFCYLFYNEFFPDFITTPLLFIGFYCGYVLYFPLTILYSVGTIFTEYINPILYQGLRWMGTVIREGIRRCKR